MTNDNWHLPDPRTQPEFYADIPLKRLLAWGIDMIVILVASLLVLPFTAFMGVFFFPLLMLAVGIPYRILTIAQSSATWGMRVMAIEFRTQKGERFDPGMAIAHTLSFTACCVFFPVQLLSIILIASSERARGLPDMLLGSVALNRRARA